MGRPPQLFHHRTASLLLGLVVLSACAPPPGTAGDEQASATRTAGATAEPVQSFIAQVVDKTFTDGGTVRGSDSDEGFLLETVGDGIRVIDPRTGSTLRKVPAGVNPIGVAVVTAGVWHTTAGDHAAVLRDRTTLTEKRRIPLVGDTTGLCHTGEHIVHSTGTNRLVLRHPDTFAELGEVRVTGHWSAAQKLGEVDCVRVGDASEVWAVLLDGDWMVRVALDTGKVTAVAGLGRIRAAEPGTAGQITALAAVHGARDEFWIGGGFRHRFKVHLRPNP
jgi:putative peptide zinc metalloprotease protein